MNGGLCFGGEGLAVSTEEGQSRRVVVPGTPPPLQSSSPPTTIASHLPNLSKGTSGSVTSPPCSQALRPVGSHTVFSPAPSTHSPATLRGLLEGNDWFSYFHPLPQGLQLRPQLSPQGGCEGCPGFPAGDLGFLADPQGPMQASSPTWLPTGGPCIHSIAFPSLRFISPEPLGRVTAPNYQRAQSWG